METCASVPSNTFHGLLLTIQLTVHLSPTNPATAFFFIYYWCCEICTWINYLASLLFLQLTVVDLVEKLPGWSGIFIIIITTTVINIILIITIIIAIIIITIIVIIITIIIIIIITGSSIKTFETYLNGINFNFVRIIKKCQEVAIRASYFSYCRRNKIWSNPELISYT